MATPVPYRPEVEVGPTDRPTPYRDVNTPIQAFGGATAMAVSHLGEVADQSGQELFQRAAAMQQLYQGADASAAASSYATQLAQAQSKYQTLEGKNAVDQLQPFINQANSLRENMRNSLQSPYAQVTFDQNSRFLQAWAMRGAGEYAAGQHKKYMLDTSNAEIGSAQNVALLTPQNDDAYKAGLDKTNAAIDFQSQVHGWSPETTQYERQKATSSLASARIIGTAKTHPFTAQQMLNQDSQDGNLTGEDVAKTTAYVQNKVYQVGARNKASEIMAGNNLQFGEKPVPITNAQQAIGGYESHNNYTLQGPVVTKGQYAGQRALGRYQVMPGNLSSWLAEAGMPNMTPEQFLQSSSAQDKLFASRFGGYMTKTGSFNAAANMWFTGSANPNPNITDATATTRGHTPGQYLIGTNAILAQNASPEDVNNAVDKQAESLMPGDPVFRDILSQHVSLLRDRELQTQRQNEFNNKQIIDSALVKSMEDGKLPTSVEQLTADPKVAQAFDSLQGSDQLEYMKTLQQNTRAPVAWTPETQQQYMQLVGSAIDPAATPDDRKAFMKTDFMGMNIPMSAKVDLIKLRASVFKQETTDPNVSHALQVLGPMMNNATISKTNNPQAYYQFLGSLHEAMQSQIAESAGKPITDKDIQVIGSRLMTQPSTWSMNPFTLFKGKGAALYTTAPDSASQAKIVQGWRDLYGVDPTPDQIQTAYAAAQYQSLYGPGSAMRRAKQTLARKMKAAYNE